MTDLNIIPLKNNILLDFKIIEIKTKIINRINNLSLDTSKYKYDTEFLTLICNLIEYSVHKKDNIDKLELCISIYQQYFTLTDEEIVLLKKNIDYIHKNKNIKKLSFYKLFKTSFSEWFRKK